jgi:secretion/DNA translocation related TadE-like protein
VAADQGVSTVFACLSVVLFMAVTVLGIRLGGAMLGRQQAEAAADLGALAGAAQILTGPGPACGIAAEVVTANRGTMTSCRADGLDLLIEVQMAAPAWGGTASAHARAGPVTTP